MENGLQMVRMPGRPLTFQGLSISQNAQSSGGTKQTYI